MQVISAGMPRTASQSLGRALEILGYKTYTMGVCVQYYSDLNAWYNYSEGKKKIDFPKFLKGYEATVGVPCCFYYKEMMKIFPEAKIIVCPRDAEKWFKSFDNVAVMHKTLRKKLWFLPRIRCIARTVTGLAVNGLFSGNDIDDISKDHCIATYNKYNKEVIASVPQAKLLVFTVEQGWEPLCKFLNKPVPNIPFPYINKSESEVKKKIGIALLRDLGYLTGILIMLFILWKLIS